MVSASNTHFPEGSIWISARDSRHIEVIDQRYLPFRTEIFEIGSVKDAFFAIREMVVRGAPLIGVTAAFGMYLALEKPGENNLVNVENAAEFLNSSRPTAVNLSFATRRMVKQYDREKSIHENRQKFWEEACRIRLEEIEACRLIGEAGVGLIEAAWRRYGKRTVNILTHCNAGWLACVKYGTATAPVYLAHERGIPVHVWVDETRPRNQGARLTAFELGLAGVPHTIIPDNAGGHLMQQGLVDMVIVGSDRTSINGDVANKTGTYLKALAAFDNHVPFYAALPTSSIDWRLENGVEHTPIEQRAADEVTHIEGWDGEKTVRVRLTPENSPAANYGFDVTPARLITALITERGICPAAREGIASLYHNSPGDRESTG